jgi:hypothetical protein
MAIFNSYVSLPEGTWDTLGCILGCIVGYIGDIHQEKPTRKGDIQQQIMRR